MDKFKKGQRVKVSGVSRRGDKFGTVATDQRGISVALRIDGSKGKHPQYFWEGFLTPLPASPAEKG